MGCDSEYMSTLLVQKNEELQERLDELESQLADADLEMQDALGHQRAAIEGLQKELAESKAAYEKLRSDFTAHDRFKCQQFAEETKRSWDLHVQLEEAKKVAKTIALWDMTDEMTEEKYNKAVEIALAYKVEV